MFEKMDYGVYFFFATLMLCSFVFVYFLIPETKAIPLEQMDRLFDTKPVSKANQIVMDDLMHLNRMQHVGEEEKPEYEYTA